jgi:GTPase SAR1 family protein
VERKKAYSLPVNGYGLLVAESYLNLTMSLLSRLEDTDIVKEQHTEANEFRVGVLGPKSCGKSSIISKLHRIKGTKTISSNRTCDSQPCDCDSQLNKVMCVPVAKGTPLGIKIVPSQKHPTLCSVHCFLPRDLTCQQSAIECDGRIEPGDLLVAIGNTSLLKKSPFDIVSILKAAEYDEDNHILITFLRPGSSTSSTAAAKTTARGASGINTSSSSSGGGHLSDLDSSLASMSSISSHLSTQTPQDVYIDHPAVLITTSYFCYSKKPVKPPRNVDLTSYHMLSLSPSSGETALRPSAISHHRHRSSIVEIVDLPGNDCHQKILREWLPRLDAIMLVYSATSTSSLLALERTFLRLITKLSVKESFELPLVVVCNKAEDNPFAEASATDPSELAARLTAHARKRDTLIMEGRSMAEAWNAPFFVTSCMTDCDSDLLSNTIGGGKTIHNSCMYDGFEYIFEAAIQQSILHDSPTTNDSYSSSTLQQLSTNNFNSFLHYLPFVGGCLTVHPEDMATEPHKQLSGRKLQKIEFSSQINNNHDTNEEDATASVTSISDIDESEICINNSSSDAISNRDNINDREKDSRMSSDTTGQQLLVKKKAGYTHDVWKLNFSGDDRQALIESAKKESNMLSGSHIVGRE